MMDPSIVVFVAVGSEEEAVSIAKEVVDERLAAYVNIFPRIRSIYRWKGQIHDDPECYLLMKTPQRLFQRLRERIEGLHSYDVPEIVALPIVAGLDTYLEWIHKETEA